VCATAVEAATDFRQQCALGRRRSGCQRDSCVCSSISRRRPVGRWLAAVGRGAADAEAGRSFSGQQRVVSVSNVCSSSSSSHSQYTGQSVTRPVSAADRTTCSAIIAPHGRDGPLVLYTVSRSHRDFCRYRLSQSQLKSIVISERNVGFIQQTFYIHRENRVDRIFWNVLLTAAAEDHCILSNIVIYSQHVYRINYLGYRPMFVLFV